MTRRRLIASISVSVTLAALAILGIGRANAEYFPPNSPNGPQYYPLCAVGEITSASVEASGLNLSLAGAVTPCMDPIGHPYEFAYEVRVYSEHGHPVLRRGFRSWTEPTRFSLSVYLQEGVNGVCVTYGPGVNKRLQCVRTIPPETAGAPWTVAPLPGDDPVLVVPELNILAPRVEHPDPECGSCP